MVPFYLLNGTDKCFRQIIKVIESVGLELNLKICKSGLARVNNVGYASTCIYRFAQLLRGKIYSSWHTVQHMAVNMLRNNYHDVMFAIEKMPGN